MSMKRNGPASMLVAEEYFSTEDARFVDELRSIRSAKLLAPFAKRWANDPRPWSRQQKLAYFALPMNVPGHQPVVKRLFKQALAKGDDELVALCLVAFDRLVRRKRKQTYHYDHTTRTATPHEYLAAPRNTLPYEGHQRSDVLYFGDTLFRYATRYYVRRAAWRYFRRMGYQRPGDYCAAIARALEQYEDHDVAKGEDLLECWGLLNACFRYHNALRFEARRIKLQPGRKLAELTAAPRFAKLWLAAEALPVLLDLVLRANSRLVRMWAIALLERHERRELESIPVERIVQLLDHADGEVQQFGTALLERSPHLATQGVEFWLKLLEVRDPTALAAVCELMLKHVSRERLTLEQWVQLATAKAVPIARLGFQALQDANVATDADRAIVAGLSEAQCEALAKEIALWALKVVGSPGRYDRDAVSRFFDSQLSQMRGAAWLWLLGSAEGSHDAPLFARLMETPYDDLKLRLIDELQRRAALPGTSHDWLSVLWASVLLGVHRGGRQKLKATQQLAAAIVDRPADGATLLPVLVVAVRSIRPSERRAGLAAVVSVCEVRPELASEIMSQLPELKMLAMETG